MNKHRAFLAKGYNKYINIDIRSKNVEAYDLDLIYEYIRIITKNLEETWKEE